MANDMCHTGHDLGFDHYDKTVICSKCDKKIKPGVGVLVCSLCSFRMCGQCFPSLHAYVCAH